MDAAVRAGSGSAELVEFAVSGERASNPVGELEFV